MVNKTVVITRAASQSKEFEKELRAAGFNVILLPVIEIQNRKSDRIDFPVLKQIEDRTFNWIVFSSANAVRALAEMQRGYFEAKDSLLPPVVLEPTKVAVIGDKTAEVFTETYRRPVNLVPDKFIAESLIEEFDKQDISGQKVLLVIASKTRDVIKSELEKRGAEVTELIVYDNVRITPDSDKIGQLRSVKPEELIFTFFSPSAVDSLWSVLGQDYSLIAAARVVSIGPITSKALEEKGYMFYIECPNHSQAGMLETLKKI